MTQASKFPGVCGVAVKPGKSSRPVARRAATTLISFYFQSESRVRALTHSDRAATARALTDTHSHSHAAGDAATRHVRARSLRQ